MLQARWLFLTSLDTSDSFLAQDLCACCSLSLEVFSIFPLANFFRFQLKTSLLREIPSLVYLKEDSLIVLTHSILFFAVKDLIKVLFTGRLIPDLCHGRVTLGP